LEPYRVIIESRWYQDEVDRALWEYFRTHPPVKLADGSIKPRNPIVAAPTGTGKSLMIARFVHGALNAHPHTRVLMATHVKELVKQNADKVLEMWPEAPLGVFSAGLKSRKVNAITFASIQTIVNHIDKLGRIDILIIDEAHLLSPKDDGRYKDLISRLLAINPYLVVVGFTASPYRLGIGSLTNNGIFTDTAIDLTSLETFNRLVNEGFLAPLITRRRGNIAVDLSNVGVSNGEYKQNELQAAADNTALTNAIVLDILNNAYSAGRCCGLIFAAGIEHAKHVSECFAYYGVDVPAVHSKMGEAERDSVLRDFKAGRYWGVVNNGILTTGFDHPPIDFIGCIRSTASTGLWVQMLGRGTRPTFGKVNCLVHDYAGNTERLGPVNDPIIPRMKEKGGMGDPPVWACPMCGTYNHARAPYCESCGHQHDMTGNTTREASTLDVMISENPIVETFEVNQTYYYKHVRKAAPDEPPLLRVRYVCGLRTFDEYVALEHTGPRLHIAQNWWRQRSAGDVPTTVDAACLMTNQLKVPARISVHTNVRWPRITQVEF
jgi:DNA repair protein RadD